MSSRKGGSKKEIEHYTHKDKKRSNNPQVGLVTPETDPDQPRKRYSYDPRLDPQLQWSGKQENSEFDVDTVSLHVHERIDPITILEKTLKKESHQQQSMFSYFETPENNPPLREAIEFYKHKQGWSNRLIAGDSLIVMNSLLEKEGMAGKVQMIYIDPPYGIKYGSNFQPFIGKRNVTDGKDDDLTSEPETIKAFRDTWELGIHSYLSYLRQRLLLAKDLLTESGSCFIQISDENMHYVKMIAEEVFGTTNFVSIITFSKTNGATSSALASVSDYLIWFSKDREKMTYAQLYLDKDSNKSVIDFYSYLELEDGTHRSMNISEKQGKISIPKNANRYQYSDLVSQSGTTKSRFPIEFNGKTYTINKGGWRTNESGIKNLIKKNRIIARGNKIYFKKYLDDFPAHILTNLWADTGGSGNKQYVVQTTNKAIQRCVLMTTKPGELILDITCGGGTTAYISEKLGRRWITCDTSRIAIAITKKRMMTAIFDYYKLAHPETGISEGFQYKAIPRVTLKSIAKNEPIKNETLYDKPLVDTSKTRITGPFTVEAVPSPTVKSIDVLSQDENSNVDYNTLSPQEYWRDELFKTGIRGKNKQKIEFTRVETHPATKWLHADAETKEDKPKRVMISFGPEHAPLEQRQVESAIEEARSLVPKPEMIIFAAMQFDPEAAKDIDELKWPKVTILKVEMNKDLLTKDLKKKRSTNESFWLVGQPDIELKSIDDKEYIISVNGFDYYNTNTDEIESGDSNKIAMWMLDTDYDGRSVYPQQVFFPMEGKSGGWSKLAKTLHAQIDEELISKYHGTESIPFKAGPNKRAAVKIIDDRGIESLKIIQLE